MSAVQHILVPVDFSMPSRVAFDYASDLAKKLGATLDVLHVWQAPNFVPLGSGVAGVGEATMTEMIRKNAEEALDGFIDEARKRGVAVRSARAVGGPPAWSVVDEAKAAGHDLIVIGTHGRTGLSHALLGSVAENVVRHAHCPVLTIRAPR
ncbi:MAG TPA: universal stress protein [Polyangiaceae bacterium]